jgi:hypothetical protein
LNNEIHGATPTSNDTAGISGFGNGMNIHDIIYQGNYVYNIGGADVANNTSNGILANGVDGGIIQYNVAHDIGANWSRCGGPVGIWAHGSNNVTIQYNEAFRVQPAVFAHTGCDWNGMGLDAGAAPVTNSVVQYNYSHDNAGAGFYHWGRTGTDNNVFRYNIAQNDNLLRYGGVGEFMYAGSGPTGHVHVYNNVFYSPGGQGQVGVVAFDANNAGMPAMGSIFANNILITTGNQYGLANFVAANGNTPTVTLLNNSYYKTSGAFQILDWGGNSNDYASYAAWSAVSGEIGGTTVDPLFVGPLGGASSTCMPLAAGDTAGPGTCPAGYELQNGSPLIGSGASLASYGIDMGMQDYFGSHSPNGVGSGYNVGADGRP